MKDSARVKYYLDNKGFFAHCALIMLALASVFRIIGCWGMWNDRVEGIMMLVLPVFCCVLMAVINLAVDIIYAFCDPRIKAQYSGKG